MEEHVGLLWHRLVTRAATKEYPASAVRLEEILKPVGVLFRALGGEGGLRIESATATEHGARRGWLQRLAGNQRQVELAWRDQQSLRLPARIAWFPAREANRELYLWLAVLGAVAGESEGDQDWFRGQQALTVELLAAFPGLAGRYERLVAAHLAQRPAPERLPPGEAAQERAIRQALQTPGSVAALPPAKRPPQPVYLWLHPAPPQSQAGARRPSPDSGEEENPPPTGSQAVDDKRRRRAERVEQPDGDKGLLAFRLESLFTRAEYVKVDRCTDDEDNASRAKDALDDLDTLSVSQDQKRSAVSLRFDLDLPCAEQDDAPLGEGILLPEWDYKKQILRPDWCRVQPMLARAAPPIELPARLRPLAKKLRRQFEALVPVRTWHRGQPDGSEVDLDAYLLHATDRRQGRGSAERGLYREFRGGGRDLACLLLADVSLSTDAWINNQARVIEVIRDTLFLFAESLAATGDRFALYGFSSRRRDHVRFHQVKDFAEAYGASVRGHIAALKPGYYTRMGAAIRHAAGLLVAQKTSQRLLLLLTDGKPNDLDHYEGRYGVEDTRMAVREARQQGLQVFCVTIDERAGSYLPHLFGTSGYVVIRKPAELPRELPLLYMRLTQGV